MTQVEALLSARHFVSPQIDRDGNEVYQPTLVPEDGGFPEPAFGQTFAGHRVHCSHLRP